VGRQAAITEATSKGRPPCIRRTRKRRNYRASSKSRGATLRCSQFVPELYNRCQSLVPHGLPAPTRARTDRSSPSQSTSAPSPSTMSRRSAWHDGRPRRAHAPRARPRDRLASHEGYEPDHALLATIGASRADFVQAPQARTSLFSSLFGHRRGPSLGFRAPENGKVPFLVLYIFNGLPPSTMPVRPWAAPGVVSCDTLYSDSPRPRTDAIVVARGYR
jgi:hypothetical protein